MGGRRESSRVLRLFQLLRLRTWLMRRLDTLLLLMLPRLLLRKLPVSGVHGTTTLLQQDGSSNNRLAHSRSIDNLLYRLFLLPRRTRCRRRNSSNSSRSCGSGGRSDSGSSLRGSADSCPSHSLRCYSLGRSSLDNSSLHMGGLRLRLRLGCNLGLLRLRARRADAAGLLCPAAALLAPAGLVERLGRLRWGSLLRQRHAQRRYLRCGCARSSRWQSRDKIQGLYGHRALRPGPRQDVVACWVAAVGRRGVCCARRRRYIHSRWKRDASKRRRGRRW